MRTLSLVSTLLAAAALSFGADGQVLNRTAGKPQAGATVTLYKLTSEGPEAVQSVKTDAAGNFAIAQSVPGPQMLQVAYQDVVYTQMIPPGRPSTGVQISVFDSTTKSSSITMTNHMMLLEPAGDQLGVRESYFLENAGRVTWNDPTNGTLRFATASAPLADIEVNATSPGSVPVKRVATKGKDGNYFLDFPVKPGETRIDLSYNLPYASPNPYKLKFLLPAEKRMVAAPNGVTLAGTGLVEKGKEPTTQASIFEVDGSAIDITVTGTGQLPGGGSEQPETQGPKIEEARAHVMRRMPWLLGLAFGVLGIGFYLLYRAPEK